MHTNTCLLEANCAGENTHKKKQNNWIAHKRSETVETGNIDTAVASSFSFTTHWHIV